MRAIAAAAQLMSDLDRARDELREAGGYHLSVMRAMVELREALSRLPEKLSTPAKV